MAANSIPRKILKQLLKPFPKLREIAQSVSVVKDIKSGHWASEDEPEIFWIESILQDGDIAIDVGANFGLYSYHLSNAVGNKGSVYSFEPIPYTFRILKRVISIFKLKNVKLINKGCADKNGTIDFSIPLQKNGTISAGLAFIDMDKRDREIRLKKSTYSSYTTQKSEIIKIDDYLKDLNKLSFIKVDVEGADLLVLKGAINNIKKFKPIIMIEIEDRYIDSYNISREDIKSFFDKLDYEIFCYEEDSLRKCNYDYKSVTNFIFIPTSHSANYIK
tara:strand:+ start:1022 stop:1846 length:825 start_codon:yes stop_codon:yes gene_type:complete